MSSELMQSNQDVPVPPIYDPSDSASTHLDHPPAIFPAGKFFLVVSFYIYNSYLSNRYNHYQRHEIALRTYFLFIFVFFEKMVF